MKSLKFYIKEAKIEDPEIVASMDDFYRLQEEINQLSAKLKEAKKQFGEYGKQITPLLDSMQETGEKLAETDDYLIKIKRFAHERSSASYKNAFEMALGKVNAATRNILEESLAASKKITNIGHSFEIGTNESEIIDENILSKMVQGIKNAVKKFMGIFKRETRNIDNANKDLKDLASGKMESLNEDEDYSPEELECWENIHKVFKTARPHEIDDVDAAGLFGDTIIGAWGEIAYRDYNTINVISIKSDDAKELYKKLQPSETSAMDFNSELEDLGETDYEVKSFGYNPEKPSETIKAGKDALKYIKSIK